MSRTATAPKPQPIAAHVAQFKARFGVATYHARNYTLPDGAWCAYFQRPACDPQRRTFDELVAEYSYAALQRRGLVAHGDCSATACRALAAVAGLPWREDAATP